MSIVNKSELLKIIFAERLAKAMGDRFNSESLASELRDMGLQVTGQAIRDYLNKKWLPKSDVLYGFSKFFKKPMDWFFGDDRIRMPNPPNLVLQETPHFKTYAHRFSFDQYIPIRLLKDDIAAGLPADIDESDIDGWVLIYASREWMPNSPENYTSIHIRGYSMMPILAPGDIVAIDHAERDPPALDGKMVAFRVNGGATVKWLRHIPEKGLVFGDPENKDERHSMIVLKGDEIDHGIIGKVAWWWSKR